MDEYGGGFATIYQLNKLVNLLGRREFPVYDGKVDVAHLGLSGKEGALGSFVTEVRHGLDALLFEFEEVFKIWLWRTVKLIAHL